MAGVTPGLRGLLGRLTAYVVDWKFSFVPAENVEYEPGIDREVADLTDANIVSSTLKSGIADLVHDGKGGLLRDENNKLVTVPRHAIILDIDYPAHLIESSTTGHYHLYLDVPSGVKHDDYMELLALLGRIGVVEKGYAEVSIKRGHSDLRLPWIHKSDQKKHEPDTPGVDLIPTEPTPVDTAPFPFPF